MPLALDPARTALLLLDYQHDNIVATPGLAEARVLEHSAAVLQAARGRGLRVIHVTASMRRDYLDMPRASSLWKMLRDLARSVREIRAFPFLPERDRRKILGENALRFLGLPTP